MLLGLCRMCCRVCWLCSKLECIIWCAAPPKHVVVAVLWLRGHCFRTLRWIFNSEHCICFVKRTIEMRRDFISFGSCIVWLFSHCSRLQQTKQISVITINNWSLICIGMSLQTIDNLSQQQGTVLYFVCELNTTYTWNVCFSCVVCC